MNLNARHQAIIRAALRYFQNDIDAGEELVAFEGKYGTPVASVEIDEILAQLPHEL